jgi:hypothetical protein
LSPAAWPAAPAAMRCLLSETDAGTAAIAATFGITAGLGAGLGPDGTDMALAGAGLARRRHCRPVTPFPLPPGLIASGATTGTFLDLPMQFGPRTGWLWDIVALTASGFTAGTIAVTKNAPYVTTGGSAYAIEPVGSFSQAGILTYSQKGMPLLDSSDRLVFTVSATLTGYAQISGQVIMIPAERLDEYLS